MLALSVCQTVRASFRLRRGSWPPRVSSWSGPRWSYAISFSVASGSVSPSRLSCSARCCRLRSRRPRSSSRRPPRSCCLSRRPWRLYAARPPPADRCGGRIELRRARRGFNHLPLAGVRLARILGRTGGRESLDGASRHPRRGVAASPGGRIRLFAEGVSIDGTQTEQLAHINISQAASAPRKVDGGPGDTRPRLTGPRA